MRVTLFVHMQTALSDIIGLRGSRKSHRCVNVSIEQLANKCGTLECQSMSVMTLVWARSEWINVGSPNRHVTTSISWLVCNVWLANVLRLLSFMIWFHAANIRQWHNTLDCSGKWPIRPPTLHTLSFDGISVNFLRYRFRHRLNFAAPDADGRPTIPIVRTSPPT